jgi:hypothetical protein
VFTPTIVNRIDGLYNSLSILVNNNIHKSGLLPSRAYSIFARLTNRNVLGKLPIDDSNNSVN